MAEPIFVGGQYRYKSNSLGGLLAEICMREWGLRFDVAIMGASGYVPGPDGGFGSGIADEVQTKLLFLSRASLRVFLCHSTKLRGDSNPLTVFAPFNSTHVDLVVTDDGSKTGSQADLDDFQGHARRAGVAIVILNG